jgi:MFS family permease
MNRSFVARLGLLGIPAFLFLWTGYSVSLIGDYLYRVGLTWELAQRGGPFAVAALGVAMTLPIALLGIFAGVIVDASDRLRLLIATDVVRAIIVAAMTALFILSAGNPLAIIVCAATLTTASALFSPALFSALPEIAGPDKDRLLGMNALIHGTTGLMGVVGPAVGGIVVSTAGVAWLLGFDAFSFAFSALMVVFVVIAIRARWGAARTDTSVAISRPGVSPRMVLGRAKEGLGFVLRHPVLRPQFMTFPFMEAGYFAIPLILPLFLAARGEGNSQLYGTLLALWAVGRVVGMTVIARTPLSSHRGRVLQFNFLAQGLALACFVFLPIPPLSWIAFVLLGVPSGASQIAMASFIQMEVPTDIRGRVFGALGSMVTWLMPLGPVVFGAIAAAAGPAASMGAIALLFVAGGSYIALHPAVGEVR